jgi:hypothetical protein
MQDKEKKKGLNTIKEVLMKLDTTELGVKNLESAKD